MENEEIKTCTECKKYIKTSYVCEKFTKCEQHEKSDQVRRIDDAYAQARHEWEEMGVQNMKQFYIVNRAEKLIKEMV